MDLSSLLKQNQQSVLLIILLALLECWYYKYIQRYMQVIITLFVISSFKNLLQLFVCVSGEGAVHSHYSVCVAIRR